MRLTLADATVDLDRRLVTRSDGGTDVLTEQEAQLLGALAAHAGEVVSREQLAVEALGYAQNVRSRAVDSALARMRRKIEIDATQPRSLLTVHGVGYRLVPGTVEVPQAPPRPGRRLARAGIVVDLERRRVERDGETHDLSDAEYILITTLVSHHGTTVDRGHLARKIRGTAAGRGLDHLVSRLRAKIEVDRDSPQWLITDRGRGYRWVPQAVRAGRAPPTDAFIGRESLIETLTAHPGRLITLLGPGGIGKTRLALKAAATADHFIDGSFVAELSQTRDVQEVRAAVALAIDAPLAALDVALERRGRTLLILDAAEGAIEALPALLADWLSLPDLTVWLTSREALRMRGEVVLPVPPLNAEEARALFTARAIRTTTPPLPAQIEALAQRLDGIPLAIELAAARTRVLSVSDVLSRLDLDLLTGGPRGSDQRQSTMRAAIAASWELLDPIEREAFARLSVLRSTFRVPDAEAVGVPLEALQSLVDKSLVVREGDNRFRLYDVIREHSAERASELEVAQDATVRHGQWFAALGAGPAIEALHLHGGLELRSERMLAMDDLQAAFRAATGRGDAEVAAGTALALDSLWQTEGRAREAAQVLASALAIAGNGMESSRGALECALGYAKWVMGQPDESQQHLMLALEACEAAGDQATRVHTLRHLGALEHSRRRDAIAQTYIAEGLEIARRERFERLEAVLDAQLGFFDHDQGRYDRAHDRYARAIAIFDELGDLRNALIFRTNLASACRERGRADQARALLQRAVADAKTLGARRLLVQIQVKLAALDREQGDPDRARKALQQAQRISREIGARFNQAQAMANLARVDLDDGRHQEAIVGFDRAIAIFEELGDATFSAIFCALRAQAAHEDGRMETARVGFDRAIESLTSAGDPRSEAFARVRRAALRRDLGDVAGAEADLDAAATFVEPVLAVDIWALRAHLAVDRADAEAVRQAAAQAREIAGDAPLPASDMGRALARAQAALVRQQSN